MTSIRRIANSLLQRAPGFQVLNSLVYMCPVSDILKGFYVEPSGFDKDSFYATSFVLPLYVPARHVHFTFGCRLRRSNGGDRWRREGPDVIDELRELIKPIVEVWRAETRECEAFRRYLRNRRESGNPYVQEAIAYTSARLGDPANAAHELRELLAMLSPSIPWQAEMAKRAKILGTAIETNEEQSVLSSFREQTLRSLGIGNWSA